MGERKVLNKYYPPDFDPAKTPGRRQPKNQQSKVRMMLPMISIRCNRCGNYMYKGTKFNSRKENVVGETYLGIQVFRFYFKCTNCSAEITMKTDPRDSDYVAESGALRYFERWRTEYELVDEERNKRDGEEIGDVMKSLENRTVGLKREMDILAVLDEIKSIKSRHATISVDAMIEALQPLVPKVEEDKLVEEDEALIRSIFHESPEFVRRINDEELEDDEDLTESTIKNINSSLKRRKISEEFTSIPTAHLATVSTFDSSRSKKNLPDNGKLMFKSSTVKISIVKKKPSDDNPKEENKDKAEQNNTHRKDKAHQEKKEKSNIRSNVLHSLCQQYDSDEDD